MADNSYEVGFGKPPKHSQFRKGRSGNPKGRPKGSKNLYALIRKVLEEKIIVKGPGGTRSVTKLDAAFMQLANKAVNGDIKALREVIRLREKMQEQEPYLNAPTFVVNFVDPDPVKPRTEEDDKKSIKNASLAGSRIGCVQEQEPYLNVPTITVDLVSL